ncbi:MAG: acyl-CoA dehydrogenase [Thermoleophilia bacterium]|nr:acyl-CoA dehydrogenase [Thermoleophilia bacterium]
MSTEIAGTRPFSLNDDHRDIAALARQFADEQLAPGALEWEQDKDLPLDVLRMGAESGFGGIYVSEEHGGSGLSRLDAALIFEALGTGDPSVAAYISIHNMVAWMIDSFGDDAQKERFLPALTSMDQLGAYCLTESSSGSDAAALKARAELSEDGTHYVLTGDKAFISGAGTAGVYIIMARTGGPGPKGISAFIVEDGAEGLGYGALEKKLGWVAQPTRTVTLDGVKVPVENRLGEEGKGFNIAMAGLNGGRLNIGACSIGGAQFALEKSLAYVTEREAFGAPLANLQHLQFQLADMATDLEAARTLLWRAAATLDAKDPEATKLCAMAKRFATDAASSVADKALQIHGGYGCMTEYGIEKVFRDLRVHQVVEGTNEIMRVVIARDLLKGARA